MDTRYYPHLLSPVDPDEDYVPPTEVLDLLPDPRQGNRPGEQAEAETPGPVMRAAQTKDIRILEGLLAYGFPPTNYIIGPLGHHPWQSSITNAILAGPEFDGHLKLLIQNGGWPDGFPRELFRLASSRFLHGRNHHGIKTTGRVFIDRPLAMAGLSSITIRQNQAVELLPTELDFRRKMRSRFWAEPDFPRTNTPTNFPAHPLSTAIQTDNIAIYEYLARHDADEKAWLGGAAKYPVLHDELPPSYFTIESPLIAAVKARNTTALRFLLEQRGHKPDIFPMALVTRCLNPLMAALTGSKPWLEGFDVLASYADTSLLTPIYRCHVLHFAVSTLHLTVIKHVIEKLGGAAVSQDVAPTALGHTLLHVASLPFDDTVVNMHSRKIYTSIHEFGNTSETWTPQYLTNAPPPAATDMARARGRGRGRGVRSMMDHGVGSGVPRRYDRAARFRNVSEKESKSQAEVLLYLLSSGSVRRDQLAAQDVYGNTALHYLASFRNPDNALIQTFKQRVQEPLHLTLTPGAAYEIHTGSLLVTCIRTALQPLRSIGSEIMHHSGTTSKNRL